jgi:hypothetical protein
MPADDYGPVKATETGRSLLVVDITSVTQSHDDHQEHVVLDGVDDAVVADPDSKAWPALKRMRTGRSRIVGEQGDGALDSTTVLRIELAQGACC